MKNLFPRPAIMVCLLALSISVLGQTETTADSKRPTPTPASKGPVKITSGDQVAEVAIVYYGFPAGRTTLGQIRRTTSERGTTTITGADGKSEQAIYQRYVIRGDDLQKEKIRLDQEFPGARYSLVFEDGKVYGIYNNTVFTPREDARRMFENQIHHGLEALLRYKENGSTIELASREKQLGVDYYLVDVTDKQGRKTRFYISTKSYRVMMLTYEEGGVRYRRRFYDYNYAQSTLVPYRSVLWADDKIVEETEIGTITFGQKVDEGLFALG